jgi:hypothetical protein
VEIKPEVREKVLAVLDGNPYTRVGFASGWLAQEINELDLDYADSDNEDIHVRNVLEQLVKEGLCGHELVGDCPACGYQVLFEQPGPQRCSCPNPRCGQEIVSDTLLYVWLGDEGRPTAAPCGPRLRHSGLAAERLRA